MKNRSLESAAWVAGVIMIGQASFADQSPTLSEEKEVPLVPLASGWEPDEFGMAWNRPIPLVYPT